jgi:hypothetical protein
MYNHHQIAWSKQLLLAISEHRAVFLISTHRRIGAGK